MAINKVIYDNETLLDLTNDNINSEAILQGYSTHDSTGNLITGEIPILTDYLITPANFNLVSSQMKQGISFSVYLLSSSNELRNSYISPFSDIVFYSTDYQDAYSFFTQHSTITVDDNYIISTLDNAYVNAINSFFITITSPTLTMPRPSDLISENIVEGKTIFGVEGNLKTQSFYTGPDHPSDSLGEDGDLYFITEE